jgi:tetraacyldisaccharide 4'-kinase
MYDATAYHALVSGERRGIAAAVARGTLSLASWGYGAAVALRNRLYDARVFQAHAAGVPVVSVGNLTLGGTGKTPIVELVCRWFLGRGRRVVVLSRGYAAHGSRNDEALVLQANLPSVPHLQHRDRVAIARRACREHQPHVLVLDDGFQHRRLARDLDIVLIDCTQPFGYGRLFPRGLLREPLAGLRRAHLIALTRTNAVPDSERQRIRDAIARVASTVPVIETTFRPNGLCGHAGVLDPLDRLRGRRVLAFCAIGNPLGFWQTVRGLGADLLDTRSFRDHHHYGDADLLALDVWVRQSAPDFVLVTQKDLVKIPRDTLGARPLRAVRIEAAVTAGGETLDEQLGRLCKNG